MVTIDSIMLPLALWAALALKQDRLTIDIGAHSGTFLVALVAAVATFWVLGIYRSVIRFVGRQTMIVVIAGVTISAAAAALYGEARALQGVTASTLAIYWTLALLCVAGSRFLMRSAVNHSINGRRARRVVIYGAGEAGGKLCSVLLGGPDFVPVAFVDDDRSLRGSCINGIRVYGASELPKLIARHGVERVLLAMPCIQNWRRREILDNLAPLGVHVQSLPDLSDIIAGRARIDEVREVEVADLLGRNPVPPHTSLFGTCIRGKSVMVTGAGGSIGSELCRQILPLKPRRLVMLEMSEFALYNIDRELREMAKKHGLVVEIVPLLGNAHHLHRVREVLQVFEVKTVYHAAGYKHVPIVEHNIIEGIHNNVIGTWYTAEAALDAGVETFVLISTDKAVNPTNVMGATKRMSELVLQALQHRTKATRFCMVRFGNVLASSGSVVPLFQEQIKKGGPVTVTHPDVIRYFMTIPEAAQLVIQAGAMAGGGDVFVLDMGQPVRIDALARRLIGLMGMSVRDASNPHGDIEIKYTGLRAAEKLYEELLIGTNVAGTDHPMIMRAMEHSSSWARMQQLLNELLLALNAFDCDAALQVLADAVVEFHRGPEIRDHVWTHKVVPPKLEDRKVSDLAAKRRQSEAGMR
ncbi:MAG: nucleoside-diphosphate sugar epimerase/dehydratase [Steroidobacteraceae bacterium]